MPGPVTHSLVKALRAVPVFEALDDATLLAVAAESANLFWAGGAVVFEPGAPAEALYVVLSGRVRVYDRVDGREEDVVTVGRGGYFGEHSLMLDTIHSKWAEASEQTELMVLPRAPFRELVDANPALAAHLRSRMEARGGH